MKEPAVTNRHDASPADPKGSYTVTRLAYYIKNGQALYWCSFFILILIEFLLGGQLSKILTEGNYSLYVNVLNTLPFYNIVVNLGLSYCIVYIISYNPDIRFRVFRQTLQLQTVWYLLLIAAHVFLLLVFNINITVSLLITTIISYTYSYRLNINSFFIATRSYNKAALANVLQKVSLVVIFFIIHYTGILQQQLNNRFIAIYPAIELGIVILYFIFFWHTTAATFGAADINYKKRLLKYGKYATFNNGLNLLNFSILALIVRSSHTDASIQIILLLCIIFFRYTGVAIAPFLPVMTPSLTSNKNDKGRVKKLYIKYYAFILGISIIAVLGCKFLLGLIITRFYAAAYHSLPIYFSFFAWLIPLSFLNSLNATVMSALGKIKYTFKVEVVCTILLSLFLTYGLISPFTEYHIFYYIVLTHLTAKFLLQSWGAYQAVYK
ncbi:MAG: hypothetical protein QM755_09165 [Luteolibacter sp.]